MHNTIYSCGLYTHHLYFKELEAFISSCTKSKALLFLDLLMKLKPVLSVGGSWSLEEAICTGLDTPPNWEVILHSIIYYTCTTDNNIKPCSIIKGTNPWSACMHYNALRPALFHCLAEYTQEINPSQRERSARRNNITFTHPKHTAILKSWQDTFFLLSNFFVCKKTGCQDYTNTILAGERRKKNTRPLSMLSWPPTST